MTVEFKIQNAATLSPLTEQDKGSIVCHIQANTLPSELSDWMNVNPRSQNMKSKVVEAITKTLTQYPHMMHHFNKGMLLLAKECKIKDDKATFVLEDSEIHGVADGGHTYKTILSVLKQIPDECYIKAEIMTGLTHSETVSIVSAQNMTVQVDAKSLEDLQNSFDIIKRIIADEPFSNRVEYRMNQITSEDGTAIDVAEVLSLLMMFSPQLHPCDVHDKHTVHFNKAAQKMKEFLEMDKADREQMLLNVAPIAHDIFLLWDKIESEVCSASKKAVKRFKHDIYTKNGNLKKPSKSRYYEFEMPFKIPKGYVYPMLSAFRALVITDENGVCSWSQNPLKTWDEIKENFSIMIADNKIPPTKFGANEYQYSGFYMSMYIHLQKDQLRELNK